MERHVGWEEELERLSEAYSHDSYFPYFENDVFEIFPYYWGDCTCGYQEKEDEWCEEHKHAEQCYVIVRGVKVLKSCICGRSEKWQEWAENNDHEDTCLLLKPNFLHKPSGFTISWYKYPLRDAYKSHDITLDQFTEIINECIGSIGNE